MPPSIRTVVNQIVYGVQPGIPERIFFEGKALELLSLEIGDLNRSKGEYEKKVKISPEERERIIKAAGLLVSDLESPPTLYDLARTVNLSIRRLEVGFRDLFNMSVFGFLRDYKMQRAQSLFLETGMNVSEVAWEVGYVNVSHFSAAYRKKFGILPKGYIKELRGN
jgi:AraC-like DNA-binding protein